MNRETGYIDLDCDPFRRAVRDLQARFPAGRAVSHYHPTCCPTSTSPPPPISDLRSAANDPRQCRISCT